MKRLNNEEFIKDLMTFSPSGSMIQVYVIEALRYYTEQLTSNGVPKETGNEVISPVFWYNIGMEVKERLNSNYEDSPNGKQTDSNIS